MVLLATGSRSGILGLGILGILLQTGPRAYRVPATQIGILAAAGVLAVAVMVPAESWQRMIRFNPEKGEVGASSTTMREETLERAWQMARDYPLFGVGLGNFREVSRQIYKDDFYRPPHNSYLWAMLAFVLERARVRVPGAFIPLYFCVVNLAPLLALAWLARGERKVVWETGR